MTENPTQTYALKCYEMALSLYTAGQFAKAHQKIREYRHLVDYSTFSCADTRGKEPGKAAVIIVTRDRGKDLLDCLNALENQQHAKFETIVVNNGGKDSLRDILRNQQLLLVECPFPFTPSEGRNIGAYHARAELLIFLDDDGIAESEFINQTVQAFEMFPFLGIRGRIIPKTPDIDHSLAGIYDLGDYPLPALLDIEGNMAVPKAFYHAVQGMNPLLFGAEGLEFTTRLLAAQPTGDVYYWPQMVIRHDYASGDRLLAKRKRQALVNEYFRTMHPKALKIKSQYTGLYRISRKETPKPFLKKIPSKLETVGRDMLLTLQGEKMLPGRTAPQMPPRSIFNSSDPISLPPLSSEQVESLLKNIHTLEMDLEATRRSYAFRFGQLIKDAFFSPLRQGFLLPVRVFRLIREYYRNHND